MKKSFGPITNPETGASKDIVLNAFSMKNVASILIGSAIVLAGIAYTGISCFMNGAAAYNKAEYETFRDLDLIINQAEQ